MSLTPIEYDWAVRIGIPAGTREATIRKLYSRYSSEPDANLVLKMVRSHTGINDPERQVHEQIIRLYPDWDYEFRTPVGYVDFVDHPNHIYFEVKSIASWKQAASMLLFQRYLTEYQPCVIFFGKVNKPYTTNRAVEALNDIGISVATFNSELDYIH